MAGKRKKSEFTVARIVSDYLEYFEARGHVVVPSAPLLPDDPTLLFTAAGMVPFKSYYSDSKKAPYKRAASVQKCLRAGGKQSDLENVGRTLRHHTFFEMLGNFSFGDYFKREAIEWGWELSTEVWRLDAQRIWISVYEEDDDAYDLWNKHIGVPVERIVRLGRGDNFWGPVGETGICGPSSEMHYDTGREGAEGGPGRDDGDRYIEYWNLVFPQFFLTANGEYEKLRRPGIDTGMGLERIAFILQDVEDNFHTDEFLPIRKAIARTVPETGGDLAINAAADHVRALTFAIAEGIMPSNEGRGYVLRRLLRRALTKLHTLGVQEPVLAAGVDAVVKSMRNRYPELDGRAHLVKEVVTAEEDRFLATLAQGMSRLAKIFADAGAGGQVRGEDVFVLYDTFGFPPELTTEMAHDRGLQIDQDGFDAAMTRQKTRGRQSHAFQSAGGSSESGVSWQEVRPIAGTEFFGYDDMECDATVGRVASMGPTERMRRSDRDDLADKYAVFTTDRTVFYPEGGGQVGDTGVARFGDAKVSVLDTFRDGDEIAHVVPLDHDNATTELLLDTSAVGRLLVDRPTRMATMRNHTATHLVHAALRTVLGDHVAQAGSLVDRGRLRFDFHHFQAMKPEEIAEVERIVNDVVRADEAVTADTMPYDQAIADGAMALFGEKYGDEVRVVSVSDFSKELCGGTHLRRTGEIGTFLLRHESAVGSGVRRIEALTGSGALEYAKRMIDGWHRVAGLLRVAPEDVERRVHALLDEAESAARERRREETRRAREQAGEVLSDAETIGSLRFVSVKVDASDVAALRQHGDALRGKLGAGVAVVCQASVDKPVCLIVVSDEAISSTSVRADDLVKRAAHALSLRGGGKPHLAQLGLSNESDFKELVKFVKETLETLV